MSGVLTGLCLYMTHISVAALYCSCLDFNALLALPAKEGGNKGIKFKKGAVNCCKERKITAPANECRNIPVYQNNDVTVFDQGCVAVCCYTAQSHERLKQVCIKFWTTG